MASKWRLNKAEEKEVEKIGEAAKQKLLSEGQSPKEAEEGKQQAIKAKTFELKQAKADKAAAKAIGKSSGTKAAAKLAVPSEVRQNNTTYYTSLQEAMLLIENHPLFHRIRNEPALLITDDATKECGVQAWLCLPIF